MPSVEGDVSTPVRNRSVSSRTGLWPYFQGAPDAVVVVDEDGTIAMVNPQAEKMFGYRVDQLVGQPVEVLVPDHFVQSHRVARTRYRTAPSIRPMGQPGLELLARRDDGSEFPVEISLSPIEADSGLQVMACVRDVTERVALETEARRVRDALNAVHEAVFLFEPDSLRFCYVNDGAVEQVGYSRAELLGGMTPLHIAPEFTTGSFRTLINRLISGEREMLTLTTTHRRKDGDDVPVEVVLQYPVAGDLHEGVLVALARDIGERQAAERRARTDREAVRVAEERERIARDLHDVVIQRLFAAGMRLQSALDRADLLASRGDETVGELDETIAVIRRTIFQLTDRAESTPSTRIQALADRHTDRTGVPVQLRLSGDVDGIQDAIADGMVASLTEALSNVARHAGAQSVVVTITVNEAVTMRVEDDGVGITDRRSAGFGIPNIGARAEELGGELMIAARDQGGTDLVWRVPAEPVFDGT